MPHSSRPLHPVATRFLFLLVPMLTLAAPTLAQTGADLLVLPFKPGTDVEIRGDALLLETGDDGIGPVGGGGDDAFRVSMYESRGRLRERRDNFVPRIGYDVFAMDIDAERVGLPERLYDMSVAAGLNLPNMGEFVGGFTLGAGYAGDTPFADGNAWYPKATIAFGKTLGPDSDIGIGLDFDGNRSVFPDVPLPGFAYRRRIHETARMVLGIPVTAIEWTPDDRLTLELRYLLVDNFEVRLGYRIAGDLNVFGSLERRIEAFHLDEIDAGDSRDRLLFEQRRAELGIRWEPREDVSLLAAGGYAFGQEFSTGWDVRDTDKVAEPSDEPYVRVGFEARF